MKRALAVAIVALAGVADAGPKTAAPTTASPKSPQPTGNDKRRIVGVLDVRVDGVPKEIAAQFQTDLEKQLDSRSYWLAPKARLHEMMSNSTKWTEGCLVGMCLQEVKTQTGAELVLLAALTGSGTSFGYVVTLVRTDTGRVLAQESQRCDVCTVHEALTNATVSAVRLLTAVPEKLPDDSIEQHAAIDLATVKLQVENHALEKHHKALGILTTLAGLAAAGTGLAIYYSGDHSDAGLATMAVGGGLTLGGVVALTF